MQVIHHAPFSKKSIRVNCKRQVRKMSKIILADSAYAKAWSSIKQRAVEPIKSTQRYN